ncbi:MAG: hypothetical protein H0W67_06415 [Gemmatimonadales bacterium]|nr:hypothetical protein [Gemmatimonadales bacterium]
MRTMFAALSLVLALSACDKKAGNESGNVNDRSGTDTNVTSTTVKDTTIVSADTNIDVDTTKSTDHGPAAKKSAR